MEFIKNIVTGYHPVEGSPAILEDPRIKRISQETIVRYVDVIYDKWFKKILGAEGNKDVLLDILRELIPERKIASIEYNRKQRRKQNPFMDGHDACFDVECVDHSGTRFVVEMQMSEQVNFPERVLFYSTFPIQEQVVAENKKNKRHRSHDKQFNYPQVYVVSFLNFSIHKDTDQIVFRYDLKERDSGEQMTDRLNFIFLEMKNFHRDSIRADDSFAEKLSFALTHMKTLEERPAGLVERVFQRLFEACELQGLTKIEQTEYKKDIMTTKRDWENILYTAELRGEEKGYKAGEVKGMEDGIKKGERTALIRVAKKMVVSGDFSVEQASKLTGLAPNEFLDS